MHGRQLQEIQPLSSAMSCVVGRVGGSGGWGRVGGRVVVQSSRTATHIGIQARGCRRARANFAAASAALLGCRPSLSVLHGPWDVASTPHFPAYLFALLRRVDLYWVIRTGLLSDCACRRFGSVLTFL